jgi:hypothetical protein
VMLMRVKESTQLNVGVQTKNRLDLYKAQHKETILKRLKKKRLMVTNDDAISFLLMNAKVVKK